MWKRSIWLLHHWAEGALSKMNAEVLGTKLTLTCQISSISRHRERERERETERARERDGGKRRRCSHFDFFDKSHLATTKATQREVVSCWWGKLIESVTGLIYRCSQPCQCFTGSVLKISLYNVHTFNTVDDFIF